MPQKFFLIIMALGYALFIFADRALADNGARATAAECCGVAAQCRITQSRGDEAPDVHLRAFPKDNADRSD